jgi:hypothetical protein
MQTFFDVALAPMFVNRVGSFAKEAVVRQEFAHINQSVGLFFNDLVIAEAFGGVDRLLELVVERFFLAQERQGQQTQGKE